MIAGMTVTFAEPAPAVPSTCFPWCLGPDFHDTGIVDEECAGAAVEVVPGLVAWPVGRHGERPRFVVATVRSNVIVDSLEFLRARLAEVAAGV
jgi:hypothetical protein